MNVKIKTEKKGLFKLIQSREMLKLCNEKARIQLAKLGFKSNMITKSE